MYSFNNIRYKVIIYKSINVHETIEAFTPI
jgi:hypothetical protein